MYFQDDCASCEKYALCSGVVYNGGVLWVWVVCFCLVEGVVCLLVSFFPKMYSLSVCCKITSWHWK